jgi:Uma2 family endonuclease
MRRAPLVEPRTGRGVAFSAPGIIFAEDENIAPDVIWIGKERLRMALVADGRLHQVSELVVEVLSPGPYDEQRACCSGAVSPFHISDVPPAPFT